MVKFKWFRLCTLHQGECRGIAGTLNVRKLRLAFVIIIVIINISYITVVYLVPQKSTVWLTKHILFIVLPTLFELYGMYWLLGFLH